MKRVNTGLLLLARLVGHAGIVGTLQLLQLARGAALLAGQRGRLAAMKEAAQWVINTLSKHDRAAVVSFSSSASAYPAGEGATMVAMDVVGRARMKAHIAGLTALGRTNMAAGLEAGFQLMHNSKLAGVSSGCQL